MIVNAKNINVVSDVDKSIPDYSVKRDESNAKNDNGSHLKSVENVLQLKVNYKSMEGKDEPCFESDEFTLNNINWKLKTCKNSIEDSEEKPDRDNGPEKEPNKKSDKEKKPNADKILDEDEKPEEDGGNKDAEKGKIDVLSISLESVFTKENDKWSCDAEIVFKLLKGEKGKEDKKANLKKTFNVADKVHRIENLVAWEEFKANYLKGDIATFEVQLKTTVQKRTSSLEPISTKFFVKSKDVTKTSDTFSPEVSVRGIRWRVLTKKGDSGFSIFLYANDDDMDINLSWEVEATFTLLSTKEEGSVTKSFKHTFLWRHFNWGYANFIAWDDFTNKDKGFLVNDLAIVKIELIVNEPKHILPNEP